MKPKLPKIHKQTPREIKAALEAAKQADALEVHKRALEVAHDHGYRQGRADHAAEVSAESRRMAETAKPPKKSWWS